MRYLFYILFPLWCFSQSGPETGYLVRNYSPKEYKGFSQIWCAEQDSNGIMYFGSSSSILTFNGTDWEKIYVQSGMPIRCIKKINNTMFVGLPGDIGYIDTDQHKKKFFHSIKNLIPKEKQNFSDIWKIHQWGSYTVFQSWERIFLYDGKSIRCIEPKTTFALSFCENNRLFVRQREVGMMEILPDLSLHLLKGGEYYANLPVIGWNEDQRNKRYVVGGSKAGILFYYPDKGQTELLEEKKNKILQEHLPLTLTRHNNSWLMTGRTGLRVLNDQFETEFLFNKESGLYDDVVTSVFESSDGNFWLPLNNGISMIEWNSDGIYLTEKSGFKGTPEDLILFNGNYYLATTYGIFTSPFQDVKKHHFHFTSINADVSEYWDMHLSSDKLFAGSSGGLVQIENKKITPIRNQWVRAIVSLEKNSSLMAVLEKGSFAIYNTKEKIRLLTEHKTEGTEFMHGLFFPSVNGYTLFAASSDGNIWKFLLNKDFHVESTKEYTDKNGLQSGQKHIFLSGNKLFAVSLNNTFVFHPEKDQDSASVCFEEQKYMPYESSNVSQYNFASNFRGIIWPNKESKFYFLKKVNDTAYEKNAFTLRLDPATDISSYVTDDSGLTWFLGPDFTTLLKTYRAEINHVTIPVNFTSIRTGKDSSGIYLGTPDESVFRYKNNFIAFEYSAAYYIQPEQTLYRCKLTGAEDSSWTPWNNTHHKEYTNLHEGNYTFHVQVQNIFGDLSDIKTYSFTILPPWYRTWWAYTLYFASFVILVYGIVRISNYQLKQSKIKLETTVAERTHELAEKKKEITDSIKYALRIQTAILPPDNYVKRLLGDYFIFYRPKDIVSGDFYWVEEIRGKSLFAAVDCTGHGVPGAMMSVIGLKLLNSAVNDRRLDVPADILNYLDKGVHETLRQGDSTLKVRDGMDLALCAWDKNAGVLEYAGVCNSLWLVRKNISSTWKIKNNREVFYGEHLLEIKPDKLAIGSNEDGKSDVYMNHYIKMQTGDCIYIYSDGYADQFGGPNGKKFKYNKLKDLLIANSHLSMEDQQKILAETFDGWRADHEQVDDVCVIGVRF